MPSELTVEGTPDKGRDIAAVTVAAKLLNSAKKSLTKQNASKKAQLSSQKMSTAETRSSARALTFNPLRDLNETMEFKKAVSMKRAPKLQLAARKRKKPLQDGQDRKVKTARREVPATSSEPLPQQRAALGTSVEQKLQTGKSSDKSISVPEPLQNPPFLLPESTTECKVGKMEGEDSGGVGECGRELSTSMHTCPTCGEMLGRGSFVRHIEVCLRQHREDGDSGEDCAREVLRVLVAGVEQEGRARDDAEALSADYFFCQLCQKDLSHLNSHRRTLHINRCIDQVLDPRSHHKKLIPDHNYVFV
ncbi:hypothetical protein ACOMHN_016843 [Nucella lapillus]